MWSACQGSEVALEVYGDFLDLYAELTNTRRSDLDPLATVYHALPASNADRIRWQTLKSKYSNPPYSFKMSATCLMGSEAASLNNDLEVQHTKALSTMPGYVPEPYWSDIVTVLKTTTICPVTNYSGVMKSGNPPRYFWRATPDIELKKTSDPNQKGVVYNFGPCRNLVCPSGFVSQVRKCSKCKRAAYCSTGCQKIHWEIHKAQCKASE